MLDCMCSCGVSAEAPMLLGGPVRKEARSSAPRSKRCSQANVVRIKEQVRMSSETNMEGAGCPTPVGNKERNVVSVLLRISTERYVQGRWPCTALFRGRILLRYFAAGFRGHVLRPNVPFIRFRMRSELSITLLRSRYALR